MGCQTNERGCQYSAVIQGLGMEFLQVYGRLQSIFEGIFVLLCKSAIFLSEVNGHNTFKQKGWKHNHEVKKQALAGYPFFFMDFMPAGSMQHTPTPYCCNVPHDERLGAPA
jgi:hypothetical protein